MAELVLVDMIFFLLIRCFDVAVVVVVAEVAIEEVLVAGGC